jgi:hypothetical protein
MSDKLLAICTPRPHSTHLVRLLQLPQGALCLAPPRAPAGRRRLEGHSARSLQLHHDSLRLAQLPAQGVVGGVHLVGAGKGGSTEWVAAGAPLPPPRRLNAQQIEAAPGADARHPTHAHMTDAVWQV